LTIFDVNFNIFSEVPPHHKCFSPPLPPRYATDIGNVSELTRRSTPGYYEWRTCPRSIYVATRLLFEPETLPPRPIQNHLGCACLGFTYILQIRVSQCNFSTLG